MTTTLTIQSVLQGLTAYPVPMATLAGIAAKRGLDLTAEIDAVTFTGRSFRLAAADLYLWLAQAPNVSQGGQSYSFSDEQRDDFRKWARAAYAELAPEETASVGVAYGYKGNKL